MKISEALFYAHIPIFIFWFVPFFIPVSIWSQRVAIHAGYIVFLYILQHMFGAWYYPKIGYFTSLCPVTLLMQRLRGFGWYDKETYQHSFVAEFMGRCGVPSSKKQVNTLSHITLVLVLLQYFFGFLVF
jgi:hypothetical protein